MCTYLQHSVLDPTISLNGTPTMSVLRSTIGNDTRAPAVCICDGHGSTGRVRNCRVVYVEDINMCLYCKVARHIAPERRLCKLGNKPTLVCKTHGEARVSVAQEAHATRTASTTPGSLEVSQPNLRSLVRSTRNICRCRQYDNFMVWDF